MSFILILTKFNSILTKEKKKKNRKRLKLDWFTIDGLFRWYNFNGNREAVILIEEMEAGSQMGNIKYLP